MAIEENKISIIKYINTNGDNVTRYGTDEVYGACENNNNGIHTIGDMESLGCIGDCCTSLCPCMSCLNKMFRSSYCRKKSIVCGVSLGIINVLLLGIIGGIFYEISRGDCGWPIVVMPLIVMIIGCCFLVCAACLHKRTGHESRTINCCICLCIINVLVIIIVAVILYEVTKGNCGWPVIIFPSIIVIFGGCFLSYVACCPSTDKNVL